MKKLHNHPVGRLLIAIALVLNAFAFDWGDIRDASASSNASESKSKGTAMKNKIYDDGDTEWTYSGDWAESKTRHAYGKKLHVSKARGSYAAISITGSRFTLIFAKAVDYGKLDVYVDDIKIGTINQQRSVTSTQMEWISPELGAESHFVKFVHASGKSANIDAMKVRGHNPNPDPAPRASPVNTVTSTVAPLDLPTLAVSASATQLSAFTAIPSSTPTLPLETLTSTFIPESTFTPVPSIVASEIPSQIPSPVPSLTPTTILTSTPNPTAKNTPISTFTSTATNSPIPDPSLTASPAPTLVANSGKVYYVSADGADTNPGSLSQPWKTITYAVGKLSAGDILYIRGGTYTQQVSLTVNGTPTLPITISGYPNETVVLDGKGTFPSSAGSYMITVRGNWIIVKDMEIANSGQSGVFSSGTHVTVQNMKIHHNQGAAITLTGDYDLALNNRAWSDGLMNQNNKSGTSGGWPAIITCARYPQHCTLRGNTVFESWGEGISTFEALYTTIEDNVSYNNQQNFYISDTKYTVLQRNISYCTPGNAIDPYMTQNGILIGDEKGVLINGVRYTSSDNQILNNLVMGCDRNLAAGTSVSTNNTYAYNTFVNSGGNSSEKANILIYVSGSCTNCRFTNNLILQETSNSITLGGGLSNGWTFSNNLWSETPGSNFKGSGDVIANPLLAKLGLTGPGQLTADYFKITANSPAINKAKSISQVASDFFQKVRDAYPDIGADEYGQ